MLCTIYNAVSNPHKSYNLEKKEVMYLKWFLGIQQTMYIFWIGCVSAWNTNLMYDHYRTHLV